VAGAACRAWCITPGSSAVFSAADVISAILGSAGSVRAMSGVGEVAAIQGAASE
jgi:hypothetical protein